MNMIRVMVLSLMIIVKWKNFCLCKEYQLKVADDIDTTIKRLQNLSTPWDLLSKIFQYEGSVTVIIKDFDKNNLTWHDPFIRILQIKLGLVVTVFEISERSRQARTTNKLNNYARNTNTSYILIMDEVKIHPLFLQEAKLSCTSWDPRARFVVITYNESLLEIHKLFRLMWTTYGIGKVTSFDVLTGHVAVYDFITDEIKMFNVTTMKKISEYSSPEKNLKGYPIKVVIVDNPPTSIAIPNSTRFDGVNQMILDTFEEQMNFTMIMCKPTFRDRFGVTSDTGTISNTAKQVANREIDIDANMKFITGAADTEGSEFTTPFFTERIHFVVPKAVRIPIWLSMYQIFDNKVWILVVYLFVISILFWLCISKYYYNSRIGNQVGFVTINVLYLMTGQPISQQSSKFLERVLVIFNSIFCIIMWSCFTGNLFQRFSEFAYYPEIDSLEDLEESGLPLVTGSYGVTSALNETEDPLLKRLLEKTDNFNDLSIAFNATNGVLDHAVLGRLTQIKYELSNQLSEYNGTVVSHMMSQSLGRFSMGYIVPEGWFFSLYFNDHINKVLEAGLIQKWYSDTTFKYALPKLIAKFDPSENLPRAFTLTDLTLAWCVLAVGLAISCITLLIEIAWHCQFIKKAQKTIRRILNLCPK